MCGQETAGEEEVAKRRKNARVGKRQEREGAKSSRECRGEEGGWCSREIGLSVEEMAAHRATEQDFGRALLNIVATLPVSLFTDLDERAHKYKKPVEAPREHRVGVLSVRGSTEHSIRWSNSKTNHCTAQHSTAPRIRCSAAFARFLAGSIFGKEGRKEGRQ